MGYLIAAAAAPVFGPVLYRLLHNRPGATRFVDGSVYVAVPLLVAWQVLPHAIEDRSWIAVVALLAGFILPALLERASHALAHQTDNMAIVVGLSGLVLHAAIEGAAFADPTHLDARFGMAVVLHRVPVSLVVWWLIRPRFGVGLASVGVGSIVLATLAGFGLGSELLAHGHGMAQLEWYQAFVSGSLVHVVFHQGRHDHDHGPELDHHGHGHDHGHGDHHHHHS